MNVTEKHIDAIQVEERGKRIESFVENVVEALGEGHFEKLDEFIRKLENSGKCKSEIDMTIIALAIRVSDIPDEEAFSFIMKRHSDKLDFLSIKHILDTAVSRNAIGIVKQASLHRDFATIDKAGLFNLAAGSACFETAEFLRPFSCPGNGNGVVLRTLLRRQSPGERMVKTLAMVLEDMDLEQIRNTYEYAKENEREFVEERLYAILSEKEKNHLLEKSGNDFAKRGKIETP